MMILLNYIEISFPIKKLNWLIIETHCNGGMNQ